MPHTSSGARRLVRLMLITAAVLLVVAGIGGAFVTVYGHHLQATHRAGRVTSQVQPVSNPAPAALAPARALTAQEVIGHPDTRSENVPVPLGGTMTVSSSHELDAAAVTFDSVPAAPAGRVYEMWIVNQDGQAQSYALYETLPTKGSPMLVHIGDAQQVAMSLEPAGGSTTPNDPLATAPLQ